MSMCQGVAYVKYVPTCENMPDAVHTHENTPDAVHMCVLGPLLSPGQDISKCLSSPNGHLRRRT